MPTTLDEFKKLAGITNRNERPSWRLEEDVSVGADAKVAPDTGIESGKVGRVLSVDGGWAQLRTKKKELFWVPVKRLVALESKTFIEEGDSVVVSDKVFIGNLRTMALQNEAFRRVVYTGDHLQFTVMHVPPGGEIGKETHQTVEQVFFCVTGSGTTKFDGHEAEFGEGDVLVVPSGTEHNIVNTGIGPLKFYTSYSPPNHLPGVVHKTKADAAADVEDEKFGKKVAKKVSEGLEHLGRLSQNLEDDFDSKVWQVYKNLSGLKADLEYLQGEVPAEAKDAHRALKKAIDLIQRFSKELDEVDVLNAVEAALAKHSK